MSKFRMVFAVKDYCMSIFIDNGDDAMENESLKNYQNEINKSAWPGLNTIHPREYKQLH